MMKKAIGSQNFALENVFILNIKYTISVTWMLPNGYQYQKSFLGLPALNCKHTRYECITLNNYQDMCSTMPINQAEKPSGYTIVLSECTSSLAQMLAYNQITVLDPGASRQITLLLKSFVLSFVVKRTNTSLLGYYEAAAYRCICFSLHRNMWQVLTSTTGVDGYHIRVKCSWLLLQSEVHLALAASWSVAGCYFQMMFNSFSFQAEA